MPDINAGDALSFNTGGEIDLVIGGTTYTLRNVEPGTLRFVNGRHELRRYTDSGVNKKPRKGSQRPSTISINAKVVNQTDHATDLFDVLNQDTTTGEPLDITSVTVRVPDDADATVGKSYTWNNCYPTEDQPYTEGADFDMLELSLESTDTHATTARYGS